MDLKDEDDFTHYFNACIRQNAMIDLLRARLAQIATVCTDNMDANCNHRMALDFVRQIANDK